MFRYLLVIALAAAIGWTFVPRDLNAAVIGGTVDTLGAGGTLTLKVGKEMRIETVVLNTQTQITLDGKPGKLADIQPGRGVSVFTDDTSRVLRVSVRSATPAVTAPAVTAPKPMPSATAATRPSSAVRPVPGASRTVAAGNAPWPQFRGPNRDGKSLETGLLKSWPSGGPKLLWTATGMGEGYSSVSVAGGLVFTMGNVSNVEGVMAVDLATGKNAWAKPTGRGFIESRGNGPRAVPTVDGDALYALGANGDLACLDLAGNIRWQNNILQLTGGSNITWGISESVLVDGDKVICTPGSAGATMIALNKQTGRAIWSSKAPGVSEPGYASAVAATIAGVPQYVQFTAQGVIGVKADDGAFLWQDASAANGTANCSAALVEGNFVFAASGYGTGCSLIEIGRNGPGLGVRQVYRNRNLINHHGGMVQVDGFVYGCDERSLVCLDAKTGEIAWQDRCVGKGSISYADGHLYVRGENGSMALVEANPRQFVEKGRFDPPRGDKPSWAYPVIAAGKLLLRDQDQIFCYDIKQ